MKFATVATLTALAVLASLAVKSYASGPEGGCQRVPHEVSTADIDPLIILPLKIDIGRCEFSDEKYLCVPLEYRDAEYIIKVPGQAPRYVRHTNLTIQSCHLELVTSPPPPPTTVTPKPATEKPPE